MEPAPADSSAPPKLTLKWRDHLKDAIIIGTAAAGLWSWLGAKADNYVQSAGYARDQRERAERDDRIQERIKALEVRASTIEKTGAETASDVKVMRAEQVGAQQATQKTLDRIETILDERHRR